MKGRAFFLLSLAALSLLIAVATRAETVTVSDAEGLVRVFESADEKAMGNNVVLADDINFGTIIFTPFGLNSSTGKCTPYRGTFQGNGHLLKGLFYKSTNTQFPHAGLFCGLDGATIEDVIFDGSCQIYGVDSGALAVATTGSATVRDVTSQTRVYGTGSVGGLIARIESPSASSIVFDRCVVEGLVSNSGNYTGGFVGVSSSDLVPICFIESESRCRVDSTGIGATIGGFIGLVGNNLNTRVDINGCTSSGTLSAQSVGGADIAVGGLIGQFKSWTNLHFLVQNVASVGSIEIGQTNNSVYAGGLVGLVQNVQRLKAFTIQQSTSKTRITVTQKTCYGVYTGGMVGCLNGSQGGTMDISDSQSTLQIEFNGQADYTYTYVGGFIGRISHSTKCDYSFTNAVSEGEYDSYDTLTGEFYAGGFIGEFYNNGPGLSFKNVTNKLNARVLTVNAHSYVGGLVGVVGAEYGIELLFDIFSSANYGNLTCDGGTACGFFFAQTPTSIMGSLPL